MNFPYPKVLVSATAVGYYGSSETRVFYEKSPSGNDYLAEVCREWETAALGVDKGVMPALVHIGVVLGKEGGALAKMIPLLVMFAGGLWVLEGSGNRKNTVIRKTGVINGTAPSTRYCHQSCSWRRCLCGS